MNDFDIVERYETDDVIKFIHANGMETALKTVPTCGNTSNKAVLFVSSSVGCRQKCKFCYLTTKNMKYQYVDEDTIVEACKEVLEYVDISDKYFKLSFMGMGEAFDSCIDIHSITLDVISYALSNELVAGIDGVDIGTSAPTKYDISTIDDIHFINEYLSDLRHSGIPFNPENNYRERSLVRLFFSLHSTDNGCRRSLMPMARSMRDLNTLVRKFKMYNVIFHCMFLDGVNDSVSDIVNVRDYIFWQKDSQDIELRLLRFNKCADSKYFESPRIDEIINFFKQQDLKFKYQVSAGSEITAACGQFLCKSE